MTLVCSVNFVVSLVCSVSFVVSFLNFISLVDFDELLITFEIFVNLRIFLVFVTFVTLTGLPTLLDLNFWEILEPFTIRTNCGSEPVFLVKSNTMGGDCPAKYCSKLNIVGNFFASHAFGLENIFCSSQGSFGVFDNC